jgi:hypothetical protein
LVLVGLKSGSAQLSYHLRPSLLSTLFLSTLRPISGANNKTYNSITVYTAVQTSHCIISNLVALKSYWLHETYFKYNLYILGGQRAGKKPLEGRRLEDNINKDVK